MKPRRTPARPPATWPFAVAIGLAALALGSPAALAHRPGVESADGVRPTPADGRHDAPLPCLVGREWHDLPDAGLRPDRAPARAVAGRGIEPALPASQPAGPPRWPHLVAGRVRHGAHPGHPARAPLHVLLCVWLT